MQVNSLRMNKAEEYCVITVLSVGCFIFLLFLLLGNRFWDTNVYNTYALQADRWRQGFLDLGQNYTWLELAMYNGKYYCSFPPFPSCILFPLTFFWGSQTPDYVVMFIINIVLTVFLYKLAVRLGVREEQAMFWTLFVTVGANTLFIMVEPYVWFFAQLLCFTTAVMAIYYAVSGKGGISLFCWGCSVGCRPMQVIFLPVLLVLLYQSERRKRPELPGGKLILGRWYWALPVSMLAGFYMILNYLRFGNILEFGHNYLPEFLEAQNGQFHITYMKSNLLSLLRMPQFDENGAMIINHFGDLNFMLVCPIVIAALVGWIWAVCRKNHEILKWGILIIVLSAIYLLVVTMHKTMGGWQFGNRYAIDILPFVFLLAAMVAAKHPGITKYYIPLFVFGMGLNIVGTVIVYNGL